MANHNRGSRSSAAPGFAAAMRCLLPLLLLLAVGHSRDTEGEDPRGMTVKELVLSRAPSCRDQACLCSLLIFYRFRHSPSKTTGQSVFQEQGPCDCVTEPPRVHRFVLEGAGSQRSLFFRLPEQIFLSFGYYLWVFIGIMSTYQSKFAEQIANLDIYWYYVVCSGSLRHNTKAHQWMRQQR